MTYFVHKTNMQYTKVKNNVYKTW